MKYLILFLSLTSCAPIGLVPISSVDKDLQFEYSKFIVELNERNIAPDFMAITVEFVDGFKGKPFQIGQCRHTIVPLVQIRRDFWFLSSPATQEQLMHHELAHCLLRREHDDSFIVDQNETIPKSIMTTWNFDDSIYLRHHEYYIRELFGK